MIKLSLELCNGRHKTPAKDGAIFDSFLNPLDLESMSRQANAVLKNCDELDLYVTGLTVALIEVIKVCNAKGIKVILWHFDKVSGEYYPQDI